MERFLWVCLAGAIGTGVRYAVGLWAGERLGSGFPYGTLIVNVVGSFLAALVLELALSAVRFSPNLRFALVTGFCGGLTTYSSFNYETMKLVQAESPLTGLIYFATMTAACLGAGLFGLWLAGRLDVASG